MTLDNVDHVTKIKINWRRNILWNTSWQEWPKNHARRKVNFKIKLWFQIKEWSWANAGSYNGWISQTNYTLTEPSKTPRRCMMFTNPCVAHDSYICGFKLLLHDQIAFFSLCRGGDSWQTDDSSSIWLLGRAVVLKGSLGFTVPRMVTGCYG